MVEEDTRLARSYERSSTLEDIVDRSAIRDLLENWVVLRDAGDWDRFSDLWHPDGRMNATWFSATAPEFIAGCRRMFDASVIGLHALGGSSIEIVGQRAVAQTKMQILQRGKLDGVDVDVTCHGRFMDALEVLDGRWRLLLRQPVYEIDRIDTVRPDARLELDDEILNGFPIGYRHLAYLQTKMGFDVSRDLPGTRGPEIAALDERLQRWLSHGDRGHLFAS
ncbi:nuclear transport factor 2 family protein [Sphingomonas sp. QA11]|uniref:nuclear transport factor 2 family protein n=1 Tax=Sphingomonas sp. QA11 TaxID=2950605 RepID=UPI00234901FD|nr:nuclear transport factor 2 family protein [Sphingomonas sp. QA11]WCM25009.1 nuclear transport factor 2 family protein [Sphingomonas sp. QA11]